MVDRNYYNELTKLLIDLYPTGPEDNNIWVRSGGDISFFTDSKNRRDQWIAAIELISKGGGGSSITVNSLLTEAKIDFPSNGQIQLLIDRFGALQATVSNEVVTIDFAEISVGSLEIEINEIREQIKRNEIPNVQFIIPKLTDITNELTLLNGQLNRQQKERRLQLRKEKENTNVFDTELETLLQDATVTSVRELLVKRKVLFNDVELAHVLHQFYADLLDGVKRSPDQTQFDVYKADNSYSFSIDVSEDVVKSLMKMVGGSSRLFLTRFAGLGVYDLDRDTQLTAVFPKMLREYLRTKYRSAREVDLDAFFSDNWKLGLA